MDGWERVGREGDKIDIVYIIDVKSMFYMNGETCRVWSGAHMNVCFS